MEITLAVLADAANVAPTEKLNLLGVFDTINASKFPTIHPFMVLAIRIRLDYEDGNKSHKLSVLLRDEAGNEYFRGGVTIDVGKIPRGAYQHINQILNFAGTGFSKPGKFFFQIDWNKREKTSVLLNVIKTPPPKA